MMGARLNYVPYSADPPSNSAKVMNGCRSVGFEKFRYGHVTTHVRGEKSLRVDHVSAAGVC